MISLRSFLKNVGYMIHQGKPRLIQRSLIGFASYMLKRKPRLRYVDVIVNYGCNLKCEHCSCETLKSSSRRQLTPKDWAMVAKQCEALGAIIFGVQGGEPLIYGQLDEVIKSLNPSKNFISIKTNGTIASPELFKRLKKLGVDSITVGFGPVPNEYDFEDYNLMSRKLKDAFPLSLRTVEMIADAGIRPMMSVVISKRNIDSNVFKGMINIAKEYNSILNCALAVPVGAWELKNDVLLGSREREMLKRIIKNNPHVRTDFQSNWFVDGCGAVKEKIYISPYGDVLPCPFIHISLGNVLEEPLETIWRRGCETKAFSEYPPVCLAAEDRKFLSYLEVANHKKVQLPIRFDDPQVCRILGTTFKERGSNSF